jgi:hypothetical protein
VLFQVVRDAADGHPIDAGTPFVGLHSPQCFLQILSLTHLLHQSVGARWAFGFIRRHGRFSRCSFGISGFTRQRGRAVQLRLDVLLPVVLETHGLPASPSRSGLQSSFPARPIRCSAFSALECLTSLADVMTYYAFC